MLKINDKRSQKNKKCININKNSIFYKKGLTNVIKIDIMLWQVNKRTSRRCTQVVKRRPCEGCRSGNRRKSSNLFISARKRLRIVSNSESFSTKSAFVGINPLSWMKSLRDEICLTAG